MYKKLSCCKHCKTSFDALSTSERANHSRWCDSNPKRVDYVKANNGSQFRSESVRQKRNAGIKQAWAEGKYEGVAIKSVETRRKNGTIWHTPETKEYLKQKALASTHRRLVRSVRDYIKKDGSVVKLDSSWEEALAKRLDSMGISWIRPDPIKWIDEHGDARNYFPDFYLTDYDLYLDPKNTAAYKNQIKKITVLLGTYTNIKFLTTLKECQEYMPL